MNGSVFTWLEVREAIDCLVQSFDAISLVIDYGQIINFQAIQGLNQRFCHLELALRERQLALHYRNQTGKLSGDEKDFGFFHASYLVLCEQLREIGSLVGSAPPEMAVAWKGVLADLKEVVICLERATIEAN